MPDWIKVLGRFLWDFAVAIFVVLGAVSLGVWLIEVLKGRHPLNFWLVLSIGVVALAAIVWGIRRGGGGAAAVQHHHNYGPGTTVNFGGTGPATVRGVQGNAAERGVPIGGARANRKAVISLYDHVEYPPDGPPVIRDKHFRFAILQGRS